MGIEREPIDEPPEESLSEVMYYGPLIEFDSNDPEFVRGAEMGAVDERLIHKREEVVQQIMHRSNEEMVKRIAHAHGREYAVEFLDETWMVVTFDIPTLPNVMDALHPRPE